MKRYFLVFIVTGLLSLISTTALADFIDFSSTEFQSAGGVNSYTNTDRGISISAIPYDATITWDSEDGLGVDSTYFGEIPEQVDAWEYLVIDFTDTVYLASVELTNFYNYGSYGYPEIGYYLLEDGTTESISFDLFGAGSDSGEQSVKINKNVASITLSAWPFWGDNDYSVKGLDITPSGNTSVPELDAESSVGALALLFGCVLVSNGRRRLTL